MEITSARTCYEQEPLKEPFGFKGRYVSELWQSVVRLQTSDGASGLGVSTQSVLWSDEDVFAANSPEKGNELMHSLTRFALGKIEGRSFSDPIEMLDSVLGETLEYGRRLTRMPRLRKTFALNALVAIDIAAWQAYACERDIGTFAALVPEQFRQALPARNQKVVHVPVAGYGMSPEAVGGLVASGMYVLKIKLGHPGEQSEMLEADIRRLERIHSEVSERVIEQSPSGGAMYYLDCNGRYESLDTFLRLVEFLESSGIAPRVLVVEEPFVMDADFEVGSVPLTVAADESAHTEEDTLARISLGYGAVALKPAAKTLSETFRIARAAHGQGIPCFCADLTVNPVMAEWNRNLAAHLAPLPGLGGGLMEANGSQFYASWPQMTGYHPAAGKPWTAPEGGEYHLDKEFFATGGGIFIVPEHYNGLFD